MRKLIASHQGMGLESPNLALPLKWEDVSDGELNYHKQEKDNIKAGEIIESVGNGLVSVSTCNTHTRMRAHTHEPAQSTAHVARTQANCSRTYKTQHAGATCLAY